MKQQEMYGIIGKLNACGAGKEIIQIAKENMENGVDGETVLWYGKSGWDAERIRIFSKILKETKDKAFTDFLRNRAFDGTRMEILFEFYKKGVTVEKMKGIMGEKMTPYQLRGMLDSFCKKISVKPVGMGNMQEQKSSGISKKQGQAVRPSEENVAIREIKKQMGDLVEDISRTQVLHDHVFEELKKLADASEDAKEDADKMRKNYSGRLSRKDDRIRELQDQLNRKTGESAELRAENDRLKSQIGILEKKDDDKADRLEKELQQLKDEKDRQEEEIRRITDEKDSLASRLSDTEKELEHIRKELDRQKNENIRLGREVKKLKMETEKSDVDGEAQQTSDDNNLSGKAIPSVPKETFVETMDRNHEGSDSKGTSAYCSEKDGKEPVMIGGGICGIGQDYQTVIQHGGRKIPVMVEHRKRENRDSFFGMIGKKLFGDKSRMGIIRAAVAAGLDREQMAQIKNAIRKGLLNQEIIDIINSGFDAEEMEMAVAIVLAEKSY